MARIRTIKPEFPQSESMGRVSRESRLCFVLLWTLADDEGRLRGNSRMLASLLFPYDDDAPALIDGWLAELESESCLIRYQVDGTSYLQICKWLNHQKIDKATKSKFPHPEEGSRVLASPRESYPLDQGSKDQGKDQGGDQGVGRSAPEKKQDPQSRGTRLPADWKANEELLEFCRTTRPDLNCFTVEATFRDYWIAQPGQKGVKKDWPATWRNWVRNEKQVFPPRGQAKTQPGTSALFEQNMRNAQLAKELIFGKQAEVIDHE